MSLVRIRVFDLSEYTRFRDDGQAIQYRGDWMLSSVVDCDKCHRGLCDGVIVCLTNVKISNLWKFCKDCCPYDQLLRIAAIERLKR